MQEINEKYAQINELKAVLASTDYMFIKQIEVGYVPPQEIINERHDARVKINALETEIKALELIELNKEAYDTER